MSRVDGKTRERGTRQKRSVPKTVSFAHEADFEGEAILVIVGFLNQLTPGELHSCRKTPDFHRHSASGLLHPCGAPE